MAAATGSREWASDALIQKWSERVRSIDAEALPALGMPAGLLEMLLAPARACPEGLSSQLNWIEGEWSEWLSDAFFELISLAKDIAEEEEAVRLEGHGPPFVNGLWLPCRLLGLYLDLI